MDFPTLARECAPAVHISTLAAIVRHESGFDPLAIGVNAKPHRSIRPKSKEEAVMAVHELMRQGVNFDVGYGQINVRNWSWLGVTPETIFDPCVNLRAAQRVLVDCYQRAARAHGPGERALYSALSCYNTGDLARGFQNGYVAKVVTAAGLPVPALARPGTQRTPPAGPEKASTRPSGQADAFATPSRGPFPPESRDAFDRRKGDAFKAPAGARDPAR